MTATVERQPVSSQNLEPTSLSRAHPLKVANLILEYHPVLGGAQRQLQRLAPLLRAENIDLSILTRRYPHLGATIPFERIEGVAVHRLPAPGGRATASLFYSASALLKLRELKPDIIHAYSLFSPLTIAIAAKRLYGIPIVVKVLRGGPLGDVDRIHSRATGNRRIEAFRRYVDAFIVISKEIDQELEGIGIRPEQRVFIPNGVDTEAFKPLSPHEKDALRATLDLPTGPVALFSGRLAAEKRVDRLISVWKSIQSERPDAMLLILGTGDQEAALKKLALELGLSSSIRFPGHVAEVSAYLQAGDLFVLPSVTEGLSNSLLEAMAAGLPAVATRVGAAPDLITQGENGWLIPPDDDQALCEALLALIDDPVLRQALGAAARRRVEQDFSLSLVAKRIRALYERVSAPRK